MIRWRRTFHSPFRLSGSRNNTVGRTLSGTRCRSVAHRPRLREDPTRDILRMINSPGISVGDRPVQRAAQASRYRERAHRDSTRFRQFASSVSDAIAAPAPVISARFVLPLLIFSALAPTAARGSAADRQCVPQIASMKPTSPLPRVVSLPRSRCRRRNSQGQWSRITEREARRYGRRFCRR